MPLAAAVGRGQHGVLCLVKSSFPHSGPVQQQCATDLAAHIAGASQKDYDECVVASFLAGEATCYL